MSASATVKPVVKQPVTPELPVTSSKPFEVISPDLPPLKLIHKQFLAEYFQNGHNAKRAYMAVYPRAKPHSAEENGSQLLRRPEIKAAILIKTEKYDGLSLEAIEEDLVWAANAALQAKDYKAVADIRMQAAKLRGLLVDKIKDISNPREKEVADTRLIEEMRKRAIPSNN